MKDQVELLKESCYLKDAACVTYQKRIAELEEENKKLKKNIEIFEKTKFEVMAFLEDNHPKTYREAVKFQKIKEMFEKIYNEKLYYLEEENKELKKENELLKECNIRNYTSRSDTDDMNLKLLKENKKLKEENERLKEVYDACNIDSINRAFKIGNLEMENKKLKESLDIATKCSSKEEDWIIRLSEENKRLKEELEWYKKQYEHSMGED